MKTRVTDILGIRYPIIQGGMMWVGTAEMASAVSNAGGLGTLTALTQPTPDALSAEIERCRAMTSRPFAVNLTILPAASPPPYEAYLDAALEAGVTIIETAGNSPTKFIDKIKAAGGVIVHKCTTVRHALSAQRNGVDIVSIDGFECAGHPGEDDVPGLILIPRAVQALDIPVVASGGIGDGRGMAAALALGAEGINMGTRFCATVEAPIHQRIKDALVNATERDTQLIFRTLKNTARVFKNAIADEVVATERRPGGCEFKDIHPLVAGARGKAALAQGEIDGGIITAGQVVALIHDVPTCEVLIERIVADCHERLQRALARFDVADGARDEAAHRGAAN
ncbi:nitronate monooxygenase [Burkholderia sp. Bp8963]|uniref:NAD(P)H-dependent flavin oxidoreductase n=1 Tax=Burkholderia sp. Bp8963 TaxID=2184547 RepID=UPI000F5A2E9B|nr:nitronate monooxygenase family protein [Burkholderia sp. Bp8963]RQS67013.1 nitronate monooxygenase [Burkholderia sp. Bp8963]